MYKAFSQKVNSWHTSGYREFIAGADWIQFPSYPVTQPPLVLVSEHKVIATHFDPSVVHSLLIFLHY